ncbi:haloacid dehalogenase-like hydrolase family protein [Theileria parva strain Muguga]|uniref:Haloacid dehalogenase-like hydrolase n=1 Tax=Theileria parva TaxID=5875 RepID=Q4N3X4_THEPA|nr:haloacid dehalogenase-like hydrolase family protein [Theileria parva strain Muguga]EAN33149.1 haloacid dehalogenase-like hydrolase family protein [Theileria parva strain Muguga]|eukprot:XP_765432.1 hypothetical protein [Theileria parva strain Muguga]
MDLNISAAERTKFFNCSKHFWSNVPMEIYFSNEKNKLLTIRDGETTVWTSAHGSYCKFLYAYGNSKEITLLQLITLQNHSHQRLYYCKLNKVSGNSGDKVNNGDTDNGNTDKVWLEVDRDVLFEEMSVLSEGLPSNESEMERWTAESNFHNFVPKEKPKYFAVDLDRTFLIHNSKKMIENVKSFEHLRENNFVPFFCTGRSYQCAFDGFNEIMSQYSTYNGYPGVYNNGAMVFDSHGNIIHSNTFSHEYMEKLVQYIVENNLEEYFLFHDVDDFYCLKDPLFLTSKLFLFYEFLNPKVISPSELVSKSIVMTYFGKYLVEFGPFVNGVDHIGKFTLYELFAEIVPPGTSKCSGVKHIMQHYNLSSKELYFVGDGENDVEIMQMLENSFAVLNAPDRVKKFAKFTLPKTHDNNAVKLLFNTIYH